MESQIKIKLFSPNSLVEGGEGNLHVVKKAWQLYWKMFFSYGKYPWINEVPYNDVFISRKTYHEEMCYRKSTTPTVTPNFEVSSTDKKCNVHSLVNFKNLGNRKSVYLLYFERYFKCVIRVWRSVDPFDAKSPFQSHYINILICECSSLQHKAFE